MELKVIINDPKTGKSYKKDLINSQFLLNKRIGDKITGENFGLNGYELYITGGSDNQGFPMRNDIPGTVRRRPMMVKGIGFKKKSRGEQQRKTVIGNTIGENSRQINLKIINYGKKEIEEALGLKIKEEPEKIMEIKN